MVLPNFEEDRGQPRPCASKLQAGRAGRIFKATKSPVGTSMWRSACGRHENRTPTHGPEATRQAAMHELARILARGDVIALAAKPRPSPRFLDRLLKAHLSLPSWAVATPGSKRARARRAENNAPKNSPRVDAFVTMSKQRKSCRLRSQRRHSPPAQLQLRLSAKGSARSTPCRGRTKRWLKCKIQRRARSRGGLGQAQMAVSARAVPRAFDI